MRALVERVGEATVSVDGMAVGSIGEGLLVYVGVERSDGEADVEYIADKVRHLRVFEDDAGKMNLDVSQKGGQVLVISAFTLQADARKGRRPSFDNAADPEEANILYERVVQQLRKSGAQVQTGQFRAAMKVSAVNDGPICILLDSKRII
jgi:D-aminoacyl-tRNA deacylase